MKGYKAFNSDWTCRGFQYEVGKTYKLPEGQKLKMCECGFHFCKNPIDVFGYYDLNDDTVMAEVEALGEIKQEGTKFVTDKIKIVREFTRDELQALIVDDDSNTDSGNSGAMNSGRFNSHYANSGNWNTGKCNSGNVNSGNYNCGNGNSGDSNFGNHNSGHKNDGDFNSGYCNFGNFNSGWHNSGNFNSGDYNSGNFNTGDFNSGSYNCGMFNTNTPNIRVFNKSTNITYNDFLSSIDYDFSILLNRINNKCLEPEDIPRIKALPNFDATIFKEITGIEIK